jgi:hypothetical protein
MLDGSISRTLVNPSLSCQLVYEVGGRYPPSTVSKPLSRLYHSLVCTYLVGGIWDQSMLGRYLLMYVGTYLGGMVT